MRVGVRNGPDGKTGFSLLQAIAVAQTSRVWSVGADHCGRWAASVSSVPHDPKGEFALRRLRGFILLVASIVTCLAMLVFAPGGRVGEGSWRLPSWLRAGDDPKPRDFPPETASGIPSLDGNGDALTCVVYLTVSEHATISGAFIFRDNTVRADRLTGQIATRKGVEGPRSSCGLLGQRFPFSVWAADDAVVAPAGSGPLLLA